MFKKAKDIQDIIKIDKVKWREYSTKEYFFFTEASTVSFRRFIPSGERVLPRALYEVGFSGLVALRRAVKRKPTYPVLAPP